MEEWAPKPKNTNSFLANRSLRQEYKQFHGTKNHEINDNGQRIVDQCGQRHLSIPNTFNEHRDSQHYTLYKWNNVTIKSQIDHILTRVKGRSRIFMTVQSRGVWYYS